MTQSVFELNYVTSLWVFCAVMTSSFASAKTELQLSQEKECQDFITSLPGDFKRGYLDVPLDYSKPKGEKIKVFYFTRYSKGKLPVVFINGGPGGANREFSNFMALEDRFGIGMIYMDQRGTGCSTRNPEVVDVKTAATTAHFAARNIVRDHEVLRKHLLGKNGKWILFGQSFGGWVVERYISMHPEYLLAAHNYGGSSYPTEMERFAQGMRSSIEAFKKFYEVFPGSKEKIKKVQSMLTPDKCFPTNETESVCGGAIVGLVLLSEFYSENTWFRINDLINNAVDCKDDSCLFLADGRLNPKYWESFKSQKHNQSLLDQFWNSKGRPLNNIAKIGQDQSFISPNNPNASVDIEVAKKIVAAEVGNLEESLPFNYADVLTQSYKSKASRDRVASVFKKTRVISPWSVAELKRGLERNKSLKYYVYMGDFDGISNNPNYEDRPLPKDQVTYIRFPNSGHYGYQDEELFWKNLTGQPNIKLFAESARIIRENGENVTLIKTRRVGSSRQINELTPSESKNEVIYVGLGTSTYNKELKQKVKGKFALIDRGEATISVKAKHAFEAGAVGFIIANNAVFPDKAFITNISDAPVDIPGIVIARSEGQIIKDLLNSGTSFKIELLWND